VGIRITLIGDNPDPEIGPELMVEIGRIVLQWAKYEHMLDWDIRSMMLHPNARPEEMPVSFKRRLDLWKRLNKKLYSDKPLNMLAVGMVVPMAKWAGGRRNILVHGLWGGVPEKYPNKFTLIMMKKDENGEMGELSSWGAEELNLLSQRIKELCVVQEEYLHHRLEAGELPKDLLYDEAMHGPPDPL
jgi:hypothetical protein